MNRFHRFYCAREAWKEHVRRDLVAPSIDGVELGDHVLEVGPGYGPGTEVLSTRVPRLTALEVDPELAGDLGARFAGEEGVGIVPGDGAEMPFADATFSAAACFTMLHHVPSVELQDRLLAEVCRVLRPGGVFVGTDSVGRGVLFALAHIGDTKVLIDPRTLPDRLRSAGFTDVHVDADADNLRFRALRPADTA